jgi:hypothetical protein
MTTKRGSERKPDAPEPRPQRRPWRKPQFTEYGPVAKLTRTGLGSVADGGSGSMMSMRSQ